MSVLVFRNFASCQSLFKSLFHNLFLFLCLGTVLMLSGCGFQPVYGSFSNATADGVYPQFRDINIAIIPDREGQILRNELIDRLHAGKNVGRTAYTLRVSGIDIRKRDFVIRETSDATRSDIRLLIDFRLIDKQGNKAVLERQLKAFGSYNILDNQFATRVSRDNATKNALTDLARQIERELALYFEREARKN